MFRPATRYSTALRCFGGSILTLCTGRFSEQRRRAIPNGGDCRGVAQKSFEANPSTPPPREAASERHLGSQGLNIRQRNLSFEQIRQGVLSHGRPLGQCDGQLFLPVFLSGTNRSNSARRRKAWPNWFSQRD